MKQTCLYFKQGGLQWVLPSSCQLIRFYIASGFSKLHELCTYGSSHNFWQIWQVRTLPVVLQLQIQPYFFSSGLNNACLRLSVNSPCDSEMLTICHKVGSTVSACCFIECWRQWVQFTGLGWALLYDLDNFICCYMLEIWESSWYDEGCFNISVVSMF